VHDTVLVVDKPAGPTSHDVVARIRRAVGHSRVGHTGTLDPAATGVLVVCLGRATRLVRFLQAGSKTYAATIQLGIETDSQDATGVEVARRDASHLDEDAVCSALTAFQGRFEQVPPMVSALKVDGERLHAKARRGETVVRDARPVEVSSLVLESFVGGEVAEVRVLLTCSAGTYVRTIAHDLGVALGVGGSLRSLRRIANGGFSVDEAVTLEQIDRADPDSVVALGVDVLTAVRRTLAVVEVDAEVAGRVVHGGVAPATGHDGPVALVLPGGQAGPDQLLAIAVDEHAGSHARSQLVWTRPEELR